MEFIPEDNAVVCMKIIRNALVTTALHMIPEAQEKYFIKGSFLYVNVINRLTHACSRLRIYLDNKTQPRH